jgi:hypothetical protein
MSQRSFLLLSKCFIISLLFITLNANAQSFWDEVKGPYGEVIVKMMITTKGDYYVGTVDGKLLKRLKDETAWSLIFQATEGDISLLYEHSDGTIFIGGFNFVKKSTDDVTWTDCYTGLTTDEFGNFYAAEMIVAANSDLLIATIFGIFKILPDDTWVATTFDTGRGRLGNKVLSIVSDDNDVLYAGTLFGVYQSVDDGITWTVPVQPYVPNQLYNTVFKLGVDTDNNVYAATEIGLLKNSSADIISDWISIGDNYIKHHDVRNVSVKGTRIFIDIAGAGGHYSDNGIDWQAIPSLINLDTRTGFLYDLINDALVIGTPKGLWSSANLAPYSFSQIGLPSNIKAIYVSQPKVFVSANNSIYESDDTGASWSEVFHISEGNIVAYAEILDDTKLVGITGGVSGQPSIQYNMKSLGANWYSLGLPKAVVNIFCILISSDGFPVVGTDAGLFKIDLTTRTVKLISTIQNKVEVLSVKQNSQGHFYTGTSDGLFISTDKGLTWPNHILAGEKINSFSLSKTNQIYLATDNGLYELDTPNDAPTKLGDLTMTTDQIFSDVAVDDYGQIYTIANNFVYFASGKNNSWEIDNVNRVQNKKLTILSNIVFLGTSQGLYKHSPDIGIASVFLTGLGVFSYNGQIQGDPQATTIPAGLTVDITNATQVDAGTYEVTAVVNDIFYKGEVTGQIIIQPAPQNIDFKSIPDKVSSDQPFTLEASSDVGLPITFSIESGPATLNGSTIILTGEPGLIEVTAIQNGTQNYAEANTVRRIIEVLPDIIAGLDEEKNSRISLSPIPASSNVIIESKTHPIKMVSISDAIGDEVLRINCTQASHILSVDVSHLPTGFYIINIVTEQNISIVKRFTVVR